MTHTNNYLHVDSHYYPTKTIGILNTLALRDIRISDNEDLDQELEDLTKVFRKIGYKNKDIFKAIKIS